MEADMVVIGGGPGGAAAAIRAARGGARVVVFEKGVYGRDKVCGDGLTPRALAALDDLAIDYSTAHLIDGLRMVAGNTSRELLWPADGPFPKHGAVWPRNRFDGHLVDIALQEGVEFHFKEEALPVLRDGRVIGARSGNVTVHAPLTVIAAGAQGAAASLLGAVRDPAEPFGLAIRSYAESPRHAEKYLEACLSLKGLDGTPIPGYGWLFPTGDGTVNIGVGALSTMKGFKNLNLNRLLDEYASMMRDAWGLGEFHERPRAWRLPMSALRRHGDGWLAVGDAAGLVNPLNGEGIDYALESGMLAADLLLTDPGTAPERYDAAIAERFDRFLSTGRRFSFLIGHPWLLRPGLRVAVGSAAAANTTLAVMGNLIDSDTRGAAGAVLRVADATLRVLDPVLRRTRAAG